MHRLKERWTRNKDLINYFEGVGTVFMLSYADMGHLGVAIQSFQKLLHLEGDDHPRTIAHLHFLATCLELRYQRLGNDTDLQAEIQLKRKVVDLTPAGHPDMAERLISLALPLTTRYERLGNLVDLEAALQSNKEAVELTPAGDPKRPTWLELLADSFSNRHKRLGDLDDLDTALQMLKEAVELTPVRHPMRSRRLQGLAVIFSNRYQRLGNLVDLETALQHGRESIELTPERHPDRPARLQNFAGSLSDRYQRLGDLVDLESALQMNKEAVDLTPDGHPQRPDRLQSLGMALANRYYVLGDLADLEAALQYKRNALDLTPAGRPERAEILQSLGASYAGRYHRLGDLADLEAALQYKGKAFDLTAAADLERPERLDALAMSFMDRYWRLGNLDDLEAALQSIKEAIALTPAEYPKRPQRLQTLGVILSNRYRRLRNMADLENALQKHKEAVELTPPDHSERPERLHRLAVPFADRYRQLGNLDDLEAALQNNHEAVELTPAAHPERPIRLHNLATSFADKYQRLGNLADLEAALQKHKEAVELTPAGHPQRPEMLQSLAELISSRYMELGNLNDLDEAHLTYQASFSPITSSPYLSWQAALHWAQFAKKYQPEYCIRAFTAAFNLLSELLWAGHSVSVRHKNLYWLDVEYATATAVNTCLHLKNQTAAVEFLEQGLATIFQQMLELKTEVDHLPADLAQDFGHLSLLLYTGTFTDPLDSMRVVNKRNILLKKIRTQPGSEYFLLPKPYKNLCIASHAGPIIILNSHKDSCDGIILINSSPEPVYFSLAVTLQQLKSQQTFLKQLLRHCNVRKRGTFESSRLFGRQKQFSKSTEECFSDLLSWLWIQIVQPVYNVLNAHDITQGRLWWLPTGAFTSLPLHACSLTDAFIHSYTATLGLLIESQTKRPSNTPIKLDVIGVSSTNSNGENYLKGVEQEVNEILSVVPNAESIQDEQATADAVKKQLKNCSWLHLACHGKQDLHQPTKSQLLLYESSLELEVILKTPLKNAEVVFLAACQTAMGDSKLANEFFHFGGGFIAAGFRGAVGTLWSMNDLDGPIVAKAFYSHLFQNSRKPQATDAAEALHVAVKELKKQNIPYERWIPFIHMGV
ncbi:CHAT domain-containing protein [Mycena pura]|uniref:CHAT domain-containing protein n=1 Tax=Mycena pura TaxID=153505 RepID=A0AAD6VPX1_9AGAR|nr:CHAT domain-containing protein [Mycena pura]